MIDFNEHFLHFRKEIIFEVSFFIKDYLYHLSSDNEIKPTPSFLDKLNKKEKSELKKILKEIKLSKLDISFLIDNISDIIYRNYQSTDKINIDSEIRQINSVFESEFPIIEDSINFTFHIGEEDDNEIEKIDYSEISPLDLTIKELQKRASERREKMKNFNYSFINLIMSNIDKIEKEPAYKRMGIEIDEIIDKLSSIESEIEKIKHKK